MNTQPQNNAATFESVWALSQETWRQIQDSNRYLTEKQAETDRLAKETNRQMKENERIFHEKCDRLDKMFAQTREQAGTDDVGRMFRKLESYRANYPMYKDYKIYLALASFRFSDAVRKRADEAGIVLIQQQGEKIEVISEKVRTW